MDLLLVNPFGSVVEISDEDEYERLRNKGFSVPTQAQIIAHEKQRAALHRQMQPKDPLQTQIYFATVTPEKNGYGVASQKIMQGLDECGITYSTAQLGQKIGFLFHAPYSMLRLDNPVRILYTMFESDRIPDEWKEYLDAADKILVPSHFCMEVFARSGYDTEVVPLGYDDQLFTYIERKPKNKSQPFNFLHYDAFNIRKGFLEVLKAFLLAFNSDENVRLVLKTTKQQVNFPLPPDQYPNIEVITGSMPDHELKDLLARSDAFIFPSRGEGFGITPLEAAATGLPVIIPNAHGISEYFNPEYFYEAAVKGQTPAVYARFKDQNVGSMIECDTAQMAKQMRYIYEHQDEARKKGKAASEYVKQFTFTKTAQRLSAIFKEYMDKEIEQKPLRNLLPLEEV